MNRLKKPLQSFGRAAGVIAIGAAAYIFTQFQGGFVSWFIFYMLLPFVLYSILLFLYPLQDFKAERQLPDVQPVRGRDVTVRLNITRTWRFPLLYTVISDCRSHAQKEYAERRLVLWGFRKQLNIEYVIPAVERGEYVLPSVEIEAADFFNWIRKSRVIQTEDTFLVYPRIVDASLTAAARGSEDGEKTASFIPSQDALMPSSVRKYNTGDKMSWIHWKSFARTNELMTKEFDEQQSERITVLLDGMASETFEAAVDFAASVIAAAERRQEQCTLLIAGSTPGVYSGVQFEGRMQQARVHLAKLTASEKFEALPVQKLDQPGEIIIITANLRTSWIRRVLELYPKPSAIRCVAIVRKRQDAEQEAAFSRKLGITVQIVEASALGKAVSV